LSVSEVFFKAALVSGPILLKPVLITSQNLNSPSSRFCDPASRICEDFK
jgi:hypothetical protein